MVTIQRMAEKAVSSTSTVQEYKSTRTHKIKEMKREEKNEKETEQN
jgi:hypothetical protein